jgi:hypothetical protein
MRALLPVGPLEKPGLGIGVACVELAVSEARDGTTWPTIPYWYGFGSSDRRRTEGTGRSFIDWRDILRS